MHYSSSHLPTCVDLSASLKSRFKKSTTRMNHGSSVAVRSQTSIRMLFVVVTDALLFVWLP